MGIFRIYPEKDTTIWSETSISGLYGNAGKDEILELGGYPDVNGQGISSRVLVQFSTKDIQNAINTKVVGNYSASLHLYLAEAGNLPTSFSVFGYPISSSWTNGTGKRNDVPTNTTGVSWKYRDNQSTLWNTIGGDYTTSSIHQTTFNINSDLDLDLDITSTISSIYNGSLDNNGILLKVDDTIENNTTSSVLLKYFGVDTNTIFPPYLEFKWDDSTYSSSLSELTTDIATVSIKNHKETYIDSEKSRFRLSARPKYPTRSFTTSSIYLNNYKLPENTYWGIQDEFSSEMIIDFDTQYTKVSSDKNGSFFDVYMSNLQPERYYRLLIKTQLDGSDVVIDNKNIFKVIRNG